MSDLSNPIYNDENAAREHLEALLWKDGRYCPHCGATEGMVKVEGTKKSHRPGLYYCNSCGKQFTVTVGTLFERSHIPLHKWVLAFHLMSASKKGISAHQLHRMLGITYKSAWFMTHRIREAMHNPQYPGPMGKGGGTVEADETFVGGKKENRSKAKRAQAFQPRKAIVVSLVERGGEARSFHVKSTSARTLRLKLRLHISQTAHLRTDEWQGYYGLKRDFASHETVNHSAEEYVRGDAHTNTVEGFFSIFKRGVVGVYHHISEQHLSRYLSEFDFRYSNRAALKITDDMRAAKALAGIKGKRLTYRRVA
ncbi:MAG TPA: IS1595 family transposase [Alphaproteobacteria bacterium]|nr:IS1595 family transposase [Alphaproteobacteria bacterium]